MRQAQEPGLLAAAVEIDLRRKAASCLGRRGGHDGLLGASRRGGTCRRFNYERLLEEGEAIFRGKLLNGRLRRLSCNGNGIARQSSSWRDGNSRFAIVGYHQGKAFVTLFRCYDRGMPNARILVVLTVLLSVICGMTARADEVLPSQVGRISAANGAVSLRPASGEWTTASINDPLATGMAVRTADRARAGISIGALRSVLAGGSEAEIARLDDATVQIAFKQGRIGIHLARLDAGTSIEIYPPQGAAWLLAPGDYDIIAGNDQLPGRVAVFAGQARFAGGGTDRTIASGAALTLKGTAAAVTIAAADDFTGLWRPASDTAVEPAALKHVTAGVAGWGPLGTAGTRGAGGGQLHRQRRRRAQRPRPDRLGRRVVSARAGRGLLARLYERPRADTPHQCRRGQGCREDRARGWQRAARGVDHRALSEPALRDGGAAGGLCRRARGRAGAGIAAAGAARQRAAAVGVAADHAAGLKAGRHRDGERRAYVVAHSEPAALAGGRAQRGLAVQPPGLSTRSDEIRVCRTGRDERQPGAGPRGRVLCAEHAEIGRAH